MFHLITGGSGSGKSEYGEKLLLESGAAEKVYVATMEVSGEEGKRRVERHRAMRAGKGFYTVECPRNLWEIDFASSIRDSRAFPDKREALAGERAVLVECMSNLAANELFHDQAVHAVLGKGFARETFSFARESAKERILKGILSLKSRCGFFVVVTNEVFSDGTDYGPETGEYIRLLGEVNGMLARWADRVTEVVYGIPVEQARGAPLCLAGKEAQGCFA